MTKVMAWLARTRRALCEDTILGELCGGGCRACGDSRAQQSFLGCGGPKISLFCFPGLRCHCVSRASGRLRKRERVAHTVCKFCVINNWVVRLQTEELGIDTTPETFVKLFFGALPSDATFSAASGGALSLHLQYIPSSQLDVSGDFVLLETASRVPASVTRFLLRLTDQLEVKDGTALSWPWRRCPIGRSIVVI